ncbi:LIC11755 family lipoprotein [Leptospira idonii]|uniref:Lamin tail domain-containing protein n=1 Tax=Leptospira idonii TaxID=1193500 RepID=A0A4R9LX21_9LEPT|nr:hypothetical protein [Leptospira idonii]TGN18202.1 hypothetical protein EHS15_12370 [Leptospira idonii]
MRNKTFFIFICFSFCMKSGSGISPWILDGDVPLERPQFLFFYGASEQEVVLSEERWIEGESSFCILSLPKFLFDQELGAKFSVCLPKEEGTLSFWKDTFELLDSPDTTKRLPEGQGKLWFSKHILRGQWERANKDNLPLDFWKDNSTSDGTVSFARFDLSVPEFYHWSDNECEILFPSRVVATSPSQKKLISLRFDCTGFSFFKEQITEQNDLWLRSCVAGDISLSESFRHTGSVYERYLEWENPSEEVICPEWNRIGFEEENDFVWENGESFFQNWKDRHKILLPGAHIVFTSNHRIQGSSFSSRLWEKIGRQGRWKWNDLTFEEFSFSFQQGNDYFSSSRQPESCRNQYNYYITKETFCGNPGLPNDFFGDHWEKKYSYPSCKTDQLRLTEFFPGTSVDSHSLGAFVEVYNKGEDCDLSSVTLIYERDSFPLSAKEQIVKQNSFFLISRSYWEGWPFLSIVKPLSTKQFKYQIPDLKLAERKTGKEEVYVSPNHEFLILNRNGEINRSVTFTEEKKLFPHPDEETPFSFSNRNLQISPGSGTRGFGEGASKKEITAKLSELLLTGTSDGNSNSSERFLEWESFPEEEGYVSFSVSAPVFRSFLFWKEKGERYSFLYSGRRFCLPLGGMELPDASLSDSDFAITVRDSDVSFPSWREEFSYWKSDIHSGFTHPNKRQSIIPEGFPFEVSFSRKSGETSGCEAFTWMSPGQENKKEMRVFPVFTTDGKEGVREVKEYRFLFEWVGLFTSHLVSGNVSYEFPFSLTKEEGYPKFETPNMSSVSLFAEEEIIFTDWKIPDLFYQESWIHRLGALVIEGVYPNPKEAQNEWVYICNRSHFPEDIRDYTIEDESSSDGLVPYGFRFPGRIPKIRNHSDLDLHSSVLLPGACAFLVDPDGDDWYFPPLIRSGDLLLTIVSTSAIGNGIGSQEMLDLYKMGNSRKIHVSTYGKKGSLSPFRIPLASSEYSLLVPGVMGNRASEFKVYREEE